jgi:hypothetical protein
MIIGDSFTFGNNTNEQDGYPFVLERMLKEKVGNVEVLDAGVGGWNSDNEAEFFVTEGLRYKPDVVVLGFFNNDFVYPEKSVYIPELTADARLEGRPSWLRFMPYETLFWLKRSAAIRYLRDRMAILTTPSNAFPSMLMQNKIDLSRDSVVAFTYWELSRIRDSATAHNIPVVIAVIPSVNTFWLPRGSLHWVDSLGAFAKRSGMGFVDLADGFWKQQGNRNRFFGYPWDDHLIGPGHHVVAEQLTPIVADLLAKQQRGRAGVPVGVR